MSFDIVLRHRIGERTIEIDHHSDASLIAITGPSGCGKTSVLNCVAGLITPDFGKMAVGGRILLDTERNIALPIESRRAGYVFQDARLFPHMRVAANLAYGARLRGTGDASTQGAAIDADAVVDVLDIKGLAERWPATLSGGEIRRVAIARALMSGPDFLLLDEPLASLDKARSVEVLCMIERIQQELGVPMLYVSHDPAEVARLTQSIIKLA